MTAPLTTRPGSVSPGQIAFYDAIQPPLPAGDYTLHATQQVQGLKGETVDPYEARQAFRVDGPRFALDPAAIHQVFPPANQQGAYFNVLPHIVFKDFALPWSRNIDPAGGGERRDTPPWMALLTLYESEAARAGTPSTVAPAQVIAPPAGVLPPCLPADQVDPASKDRVQVVDMDLAYFRAIAPSLAEVPLLAHARTVNTGGKVMLGMNDDGCFSVVVGNRVANAAGGVNTVLLVSLEGHQDHLNGSGAPTACGGGAPAQPYTKIRLVVLGSWSFTTPAGMPGSFLALMQALTGPGHGGVKLLALDAGPEPNAVAREALQTGYVPLRNTLRVGEASTAWYRGPLVPAPTTRDQAYGPFNYSDHAMHYDPETGMFNHAYSAAWQIGRLLALSDAAFAARLFDWRRGYYQALLRAADERDVEAPVAAALPAAGGALPLGSGVAAQLRGLLLAAAPALEDVLPRVRARGADRPAVLSTDEVNEIVAAGEDPLVALRARLNPIP